MKPWRGIRVSSTTYPLDPAYASPKHRLWRAYSSPVSHQDNSPWKPAATTLGARLFLPTSARECFLPANAGHYHRAFAPQSFPNRKTRSGVRYTRKAESAPPVRTGFSSADGYGIPPRAMRLEARLVR